MCMDELMPEPCEEPIIPAEVAAAAKPHEVVVAVCAVPKSAKGAAVMLKHKSPLSKPISPVPVPVAKQAAASPPVTPSRSKPRQRPASAPLRASASAASPRESHGAPSYLRPTSAHLSRSVNKLVRGCWGLCDCMLCMRCMHATMHVRVHGLDSKATHALLLLPPDHMPMAWSSHANAQKLSSSAVLLAQMLLHAPSSSICRRSFCRSSPLTHPSSVPHTCSPSHPSPRPPPSPPRPRRTTATSSAAFWHPRPRSWRASRGSRCAAAAAVCSVMRAACSCLRGAGLLRHIMHAMHNPAHGLKEHRLKASARLDMLELL